MPQSIEKYVNDADIQAVITEAAQRISARLKTTAFERRVNGLTFLPITQAAYDALATKDPNTVYYAVDAKGKVKQYLGTAEISGSGSLASGSVVQLLDGVQASTPNGVVQQG